MGQPDKLGYFGKYGGRFVPETVMSALLQLETEYSRLKKDSGFKADFMNLLKNYSGRPTPIYHAVNLTRKYKGAQIYLKREDLNHTGAHKINNCLGQALLAHKIGKRRLIAETGAGQHGVAVATVACLFNLKCAVYMGEEDVVRQAPNVDRMKMLGAEVIPVISGTKTLKDATNEALRDWVATVADTHYIIGSTVGPHPYPLMVRDFQSIIGKEARSQMISLTGKLPAAVVACVGGGSNALGIFHRFINDKKVELHGVESAGNGIGTHLHAATLSKGKPGVLHGSYSYLLQDNDGQIQPTHSVSAGLDYPGVGPEHSYLKEIKRVKYAHIADKEALKAFFDLTRAEGIIPALESSFAIAYSKKLAGKLPKKSSILVNLSGRGDKDMANSAVTDLLKNNSSNGSGEI